MISQIKASLFRLMPQLIALAVILLLNFIMFPQFFHLEIQNGRLYGSVIDVLNRGAPVALLSIGMTLVIATKGIDLSVGAVIAICGAVAAASIVAGYSLAYTLLLTIGVGLACGLWNGFLVAVLDIQPIIATLVLMVAGRGIAQLITEGMILTFNNDGLIFLGSGAFAALPMPVVIWVLAALVVMLLVRRTALGMLVEAIGINRRASTLSGIQTPVLLIAVYALSGLCASIAGIIVSADIKGADANNAGLWLELDAILAVVIGGTALTGGEGGVVNTLIGVLIVTVLANGMILLGISPYIQQTVQGLMIIAAVALSLDRVRLRIVK